MRRIILVLILTPFFSVWGSQKEEAIRLSGVVDDSTLEQANPENSAELAEVVAKLISDGTPADIKDILASARLGKPSGQIIATESIYAFRESNNNERLIAAVAGSANWSRSISDELPRGKTTIERFRLRVGRQLLRNLELDDSDSASLALLIKDVPRWLHSTLEQASSNANPEILGFIERAKALSPSADQADRSAAPLIRSQIAEIPSNDQVAATSPEQNGWWAISLVAAIGLTLIVAIVINKRRRSRSN